MPWHIRSVLEKFDLVDWQSRVDIENLSQTALITQIIHVTWEHYATSSLPMSAKA